MNTISFSQPSCKTVSKLPSDEAQTGGFGQRGVKAGELKTDDRKVGNCQKHTPRKRSRK